MAGRNVKGWKSRPKDKQLSSGAVVTIRRVSLSAVLAHGEVPSVFLSSLGFDQQPKSAGGGAGTPERRPGTVGYRAEAAAQAVDTSKIGTNELKELVQFARRIVRGEDGVYPGALVWPKIVDQPSESDDEVTLDEIPIEDLLEILNYSILEAPVATVDGEVSADALRKTDQVEPLQGGGGGGEIVSAASG